MKTPTLKKHARGTWYARYWIGGKEHSKYFGTDAAAARDAYLAWLPEWMQLKIKSPPPARGQVRIVQISEQWLSHIQLTRSPTLMKQYRAYTQNFINVAGEMPGTRVTVNDLETHAADLKNLGYSIVSIRTYTKAIKMMFYWAARRKLIPRPDFTDFHSPALPRPRPQYHSPAAVAAHIDQAAKSAPNREQLRHWLSLIYLCCARPSEIHRMVSCYAVSKGGSAANSHGRFITIDGENTPVIFETRGKTQDATGLTRWIPLSREALTHLELSRPQWSLMRFLRVSLLATQSDPRPASFVSTGAKALRKMGASQLRKMGVTREDVKRILGHSTVEPVDHYAAESPEHLRALVSRLTLPRASASIEDEEWVPPT